MDDFDLGELLGGTTIQTSVITLAALIVYLGGKLSTSLLSDFSANLESSGNAETFVYGAVTASSIGASSQAGGDVVAVFPDNNGSLNKKDYDTVDVNAERIYDFITKNIEVDKGTIIAKDPKIAEVLKDICSIVEENREKTCELLKAFKEVLIKVREQGIDNNTIEKKLIKQ